MQCGGVGAAALLYILTLAPTIYNLDSAELTTAAATGGLVRATGYPVYLMLGWLWTHLPLGDVGYRMNLLSATSAAATIFFADRVLRRVGVGAWASLGGLGLLGGMSMGHQLATAMLVPGVVSGWPNLQRRLHSAPLKFT